MGIPHYTFESISAILLLDFTISNYLSSLPIKEEHITELSINSTRTSIFSQSRHFFLSCKTTSGRRIRLDHSKDLGAFVSNFSFPGLFEKTHRSGQSIPLTTTTHAVKVFEKHSKTEKNSHNCEIVTFNTFEELTGDSATVLDNRLQQILNDWKFLRKIADFGKVGKIYHLEEFWKLELQENPKKRFLDQVCVALALGKTRDELFQEIEESFKNQDLLKLNNSLTHRNFQVKYDLEFMKGFNSPSNLYKNFTFTQTSKNWENLLISQ
jgi:hypothetical protein